MTLFDGLHPIIRRVMGEYWCVLPIGRTSRCVNVTAVTAVTPAEQHTSGTVHERSHQLGGAAPIRFHAANNGRTRLHTSQLYAVAYCCEFTRL